MPNQTAIAFTVRQRAALLAWGAEWPLGLGVRLTVDTDEVFEVAEIYHRDTRLALWMLFAIKGGVIVLSGVNSDEWKTDSVKAALERVVQQAGGHGTLVEGIVAPTTPTEPTGGVQGSFGIVMGLPAVEHMRR